MKKKSLLPKVILFLVVLAVLLLIVMFRIQSDRPVDPQDSTPANPSTNNSSNPGTTTAPGTTGSPPSTGNPTTAPTQSVPTAPTTKPTEPPTEPSTAPTEPPTQPTEPSTAPTQPSTVPDEPIGIGLYTRQELENLPTAKYPYGPGRASAGTRPPYAQQDQQKHSKYGANFIAPDDGNIYLTFDCGYEYTATDADGSTYRVTERILDVLKEKNVKAVFFVTMYYVEEQPDLVQRMIDEGHVVGNHSANHPVMPDISIDRMIKEVMDLHEYVLEHFGYEMHLFRPPTGQYSVQSLAVVQNLGYKNVHWSFAYLDYDTSAQPDLDYAYERITGSHHSGAIYLLHAVSTANAAVLGDVIDFFVDQGYNLELFT